MNNWWLDPGPIDKSWSREERQARLMILGLSLPIFLLLFGTDSFLLASIGISSHLVAASGLFLLAPSLYLSRKFCVYVWKGLMRQADRNAATRIAKVRET